MLEGLIPSVGTVGDALDNALCETTIGLYKTECVREGSPFRTGPIGTLADLEDEHIREVMSYTSGNRSAAARILGINRRTLRLKLHALRIDAEVARLKPLAERRAQALSQRACASSRSNQSVAVARAGWMSQSAIAVLTLTDADGSGRNCTFMASSPSSPPYRGGYRSRADCRS